MIQLMHPQYALIADDMTGANDAGIQFAGSECRVRTLFSGWDARSFAGVQLVVIDTDSRNLEAGHAATIVRACVEQLSSHHIHPLYKKIDSTVRGPIGAEVQAIMEAAGFTQAVVCPAYPSAGRTVEGGLLLVDGRPVAETPIGRDLLSPVRESHIPTLLAAQCTLPVRHLALPTVAQGEKEMAARLMDERGHEKAIWVSDATDDGHLESLARVLVEAGDAVLAVGSAGLARPFACLVAPRLTVQSPAGVLFVCGSNHPATRAQVAVMVEEGGAQQIEFEPTRAEPSKWAAWVRQIARTSGRQSQSGPHIILTTPVDSAVSQRSLGAARQLAMLATHLLETMPIAGVLATGGDTARALFEEWQATGVDLVAEVVPGVPLGRIVDGQFAGMAVITKAGGFGGPDLFRRAAAVLAYPYVMPAVVGAASHTAGNWQTAP